MKFLARFPESVIRTGSRPLWVLRSVYWVSISTQSTAADPLLSILKVLLVCCLVRYSLRESMMMTLEEVKFSEDSMAWEVLRHCGWYGWCRGWCQNVVYGPPLTKMRPGWGYSRGWKGSWSIKDTYGVSSVNLPSAVWSKIPSSVTASHGFSDIFF